MTLNQRRRFLVAFGGVLVASRMYVSTSVLLSCYERVFSTKKSAYFMISEYWTFGLQNLFVRTREPFFSNLRTFGLKNLRTHEPSNLRTFGRIGCNLHIYPLCEIFYFRAIENWVMFQVNWPKLFQASCMRSFNHSTRSTCTKKVCILVQNCDF